MSDSYFKKPLVFKIRKVLRYLRLYGVSRTFVKVRAQYHMKRLFPELADQHEWANPGCKNTSDTERAVGIIGCGSFAYSAIAYYLRKEQSDFLKTALDTDLNKAISLTKDYGGAIATTDVETILNDDSIRIVFIASNHASHAEYAVRCIEAGKHVHIEKPHVVSEQQLCDLNTALERNPDVRVFLGFNRPKSEHFRRVREALDNESGPTMINWFIAGHEIPDDHWYFNEQEGGRVLGNLCHWTDLTLQLVGKENAFPCEIVPASHQNAKSDYCVGFRFADGSIAGITFSAKGHTFEGVKEVLQVHRENLLGSIRDFKETTIEVIEKKSTYRSFYRDHGHGRNIRDSWNNAVRDTPIGDVDQSYMTASANLFLAVRHAIDNDSVVRISGDAASFERVPRQ